MKDNEIGLDIKIAFILALIYILLNIFYKKMFIIFVFFISFAIMTFIYVMSKEPDIINKMNIIISFSILISFIVSLLISDVYKEDFANKKTKKHKKIKKNVVYDTNKEDDFGSNHVDLGTSFLEAYKNLDKSQVNSMTKDTKELIKTQKTLMSTLENLGPIVKEGKTIIDTFKGYFDKEEDK